MNNLVKTINVNNTNTNISTYGYYATIKSSPLALTNVHCGDIVTVYFDSYELLDDRLANIGFAIGSTGWSSDTIFDNADVVDLFNPQKNLKQKTYHITRDGTLYAILFIYNCCVVNFYWSIRPNDTKFSVPFTLNLDLPITVSPSSTDILYRLPVNCKGYVKIVGNTENEIKIVNQNGSGFINISPIGDFVIYANVGDCTELIFKTKVVWDPNETLTIYKILFADANYTDIVNVNNKIDNIDISDVYEKGIETIFGFNTNYDLGGSFLPSYTEHITIENSAQTEDTFIKNIHLRISKASATFKFKIGIIDQRNIFVERYSFIADVINNVVDIPENYYDIKENEYLVVNTLSEDRETSVKYAAFNASRPSFAYKNFIYGDINGGQLAKLATENGGIIDFYWTTLKISSQFVFKSELDNIYNMIGNNTEQINKQRYVYDSDGVAYKQIVVNGELKLKPVNYKRVLCLGNSLTSHGYAENIGYYGDDAWAMSSTNKETTTWSKRLETILKQKEPTAVTEVYNIYAWETNPINSDLDEIFEDYSSNTYDLIVFRTGENSGSNLQDVYEQGFRRLMTYLKNTFPLADILVTSLFWRTEWKDTVFKNVAEDMNLMYLDFGSISDRCLLGQMLMGRDNVMHPIVHSGVAGHCTDICYVNYPNAIGSYFGYNMLDIKHSVNITSSVEYNINNTTQTYQSYVSILTYGSSQPTITVTDSESNNISVTHYSLANVSWMATPNPIPTYSSVFLMPDNNVTVTIS